MTGNIEQGLIWGAVILGFCICVALGDIGPAIKRLAEAIRETRRP